MMELLLAAVTALGSLLAQPEVMEIRTVRFYRGAGTTLVDGFCRVPFSVLQSLSTGGGAAYRVEITVKDSTGLVLTSSAWSQVVRRDVLKVPGASAVEHFTFAADHGRYDVEVAITDSATGKQSHRSTSVEAYGTAPAASDVILTNGLRRPLAGDTVTQPGEIRKGAVFLIGATRPVLTPVDSRLFYYVELYPGHPTQADIAARVRGADGRELFSAQSQPRSVSGAGGVAASAIDLAGLPPGNYRLELDVRYSDTTVVREGEFEVAGFEVAAAVNDASTGGTGANDSYASLTEAALDSLYFPLVHIIEASEQGIYEGMTVEGKRNFLRQFWAKRGPTPGTPDNEARTQYYARISESNRRFREGGSAQVQGWRTDRGRIYIRYGEPDEKLSRPQSGTAPPYEVWKYTRGRARKFVFLDETRFGHYALLYTDERREPSRPDWESILGREAAQDVQRF